MKTKLIDKLVAVLVVDTLLIYSTDKLTTKEARKGDVIDVPGWMAKGLESEGRVSMDIPDVLEDVADDEDDEDLNGPMTVAELKELTDIDLAELETTRDLIVWVEGIDLLNELVIHPSCKRETSIGKIFDAIEALED